MPENSFAPSKRAQGRPGASAHPWSACNKKARGRTTGVADHPALPARWFYGLYVISPVTMLGCHRHRQSARCALCRFSACIGAPGPHDFAVRTTAARRARIAPGDVRPSHPMPHVRDDRDTPLLRAGMAETVNVIWGNREAEYFSREGWTDFRARGFFARRANHLR